MSLNEFSYTLRLVRKNTAFSIFCVLIIATGTAISLTLFSLLNNLGLKQLPFADSEKYTAIVMQIAYTQNQINSGFDAGRFRYLEENSQSFKHLWPLRLQENATLSDAEFAQRFMASGIDPELMQYPAVQPLMGRVLAPEDALPDASPVVVLSYSLWQNYYAGRDDIIGHRSRINGEYKTVVGVMPDSFKFPFRNDLWLPLRLQNNVLPGEGPNNLSVVGILEDGVSIREADAEIALLNNQFKTQWQDEYEFDLDTRVVPYTRIFSVPNFLLFGFGMFSVLVALLVSFSITNLLFVRVNERSQELAIRNAIGATPLKLLLTLFQETFLLCFTGCVLGLFLTYNSLAFIGNIVTNNMPPQPFWVDIKMDTSVVITAILISLFIWTFSGSLSFWRIFRTDLSDILASGSKNISRNTRLTKSLVNLGVIVTCFLLIVALYLVIAMNSGLNTEIGAGLKTEEFYAGKISLGTTNYDTGEDRQLYRQYLNQALTSRADINSVTFASSVPGIPIAKRPYAIEDRDLSNNDLYPTQPVIAVEDNYFEAMGLELTAGRPFSEADDENSLPVAIIDERLRDLLWPDESPLGKRILLNPETGQNWLTVVGVVPVIEHDTVAFMGGTPSPTLYVPFSQNDQPDFYVIVRSPRIDFNYQSLNSTGAEVDRDIPIYDILSFPAILFRLNSGQYIIKNILSVVSVFILLLASSSIYGLMARAVDQRTIEIGIRRAVGADNLRALMVFIREALIIVVIGLFSGGLLGIFTMYNLLSVINLGEISLLVASSVSVFIIIFCVIVAASYIPARKLIMMEPGDALRYE